MKLQIKETYKVNGIEYTSLQDARKAAGLILSPSERKIKSENSINIPFQLINISDFKISEFMGKMTLKDANDLAQLMSNEKIKFWVPSYSEMISLVQNEKTSDWNDCVSYWTSTIYNYSTYIFYNKNSNEFEDIFPDLKLGIRFLFKEN